MTEIGTGAVRADRGDRDDRVRLLRRSRRRFARCRIAEPKTEKPLHDRRDRGAAASEGLGILQGYYQEPRGQRGHAFHGRLVQDRRPFSRRTSSGYFYIVGRVKDMIRRSGENIAAREVEDVVLRIPGVFEAACVPVPDARRGEEIKLLVVLQPEISKKELTPTLILEHCRSKLAPFKVPRYIAYADALPKTGSNKVAKGELRASANLTAGCFDSVQNTWL